MNAAAKIIHQRNVFNGKIWQIRWSKSVWFLLLLLITVFSSALAVVYSTNEHRSCFNRLHQLEQQANQFKLHWGQLLLEQASLATPGRVEALATQQLHMHLPDEKQSFILQA